MSPKDLPATSPLLSQQLKSQTDQILANLIRINYNTIFAHTASELDAFRDAVGCGVDSMDDAILSETFRNTVQFTTYDTYASLSARFLEKPCRESAVINLFSPGLPDYLVRTSSTSGGAPKYFPRFSLSSGFPAPPLHVEKHTIAHLFCLRCDSFDVTDEDDRLVKKIYMSSATGIIQRAPLSLDPDKDGEKMVTFVSDYTAPYAASFIKTWRSFLLIQALFAINSKSLKSICTAFINSFVDMMRHLDAEFDMIMDCVANGTIPNLEGVAEVRCYLEPNITPNPERAAELRSIGRPSSRPSWCSFVWPDLRSITGIASGSFASSIPLAQRFLGPDANILPYCYGSSEGLIAWPHSPLELNQFKLRKELIIEFLDISKSDSIGSVTPPWEVKLGKRYEIVLTTLEGLWRYRLGDVVEIAGFDPTDGTSVIKFIERRNVAIRFPYFLVTEQELTSAMSSVAADVLGNIVDWTATIDDRKLPATVGFFVELTSEEVADFTLATEQMLAALARLNENISWNVERGWLGKPTIRIVKSGTFSDYRQLKIEEGMDTFGMAQIKIPVVLSKTPHVAWFSNRVIKEL